MVRPILVPLDGSAFAEAALPVAAALAARTGARLHLVEVHEQMNAEVGAAGVAPFDEALDRDALAAESEYLSSIASRWQERTGAALRTELLGGSIASALATYAAELDVSLIAMTTHGRGGISRAWIGSVADAVVRRSCVPVLLVRPGQTAEPPNAAPFAPAHVLIPVDGSALSERVVEPALEVAGVRDARYTVLRVVGAEPAALARLDRRDRVDHLTHDREAAEREIERVVQALHRRGATAQGAVVRRSAAALGILGYASSNEIDLIAIATRGRSGWARLALGSVADKVMRGASVPVLLYRPPAPGAAVRDAADAARVANV